MMFKIGLSLFLLGVAMIVATLWFTKDSMSKVKNLLSYVDPPRTSASSSSIPHQQAVQADPEWLDPPKQPGRQQPTNKSTGQKSAMGSLMDSLNFDASNLTNR